MTKARFDPNMWQEVGYEFWMEVTSPSVSLFIVAFADALRPLNYLFCSCQGGAKMVNQRLAKLHVHCNTYTSIYIYILGDTRPDLSKVGNRVWSNISLTCQVCCYGASDWWKQGSCDFHLFLKGDVT